MRLVLGMVVLALSGWAQAADEIDHDAINRIVDEGLNHSELPQTAAYLTDRIGGRMTNSPQMREAEKWTQDRFRHWDLKNVHAEGFAFGRGWSIEKISVRMTTPRVLGLSAIPVAWTPATKGTITAPIVVAPLARERDFEKWKGQLRGKIVLVDKPTPGSEPATAPFARLSDQQLHDYDTYPLPQQSDARIAATLRRAIFAQKRDAFLAGEGALAWVGQSYRDGGLLHGEGYGYKVGETPALPGIQMGAEDYRRLARLAKTEAVPTLELLSDVQFHDEDRNAYNIFAEIPGRDRQAGYVMAGAHLDSWVASDGATDNGAGSVAVMEAARILSRLGLKPKRTIRFALWSGEEQALLGSMAFAEKYLLQRPPPADAEQAQLNPYYTWNLRWPVTVLPTADALKGYFNLDNGSGKVRGIYTEGNVAVVPIFKQWLEPFASMGATQVAAEHTGGTDHVLMQAAGVPAFQFIQDPLDYGTRTHHSSMDSYDHLKIDDLKQASVIIASMLWMSAQRDEALPRLPAQRRPEVTDPFNYDDPNEDPPPR